MSDLSKLLELLKLSGVQATAVVITSAALLLLIHHGILPAPYPWLLLVLTAALFLSGSIALFRFFALVNGMFPTRQWIMHYIAIWRAKREIRKYIPFMTEQEKLIIGYLLDHNQKTIEADQDGGYATTLISRGILVTFGQRGQVFRGTNMPMLIPDHIWDVLREHREQFPYTRPRPGEIEPHPWRIPWMAR